MEVYFSFYCGYYIQYGNEHKCSSIGSISDSRKSHPFIVVTAIENPNLYSNGQYYIQSYRPYSDPVESYNGKLTEGNFELQYRARCVYGRNVSSVCDVVFAVNNTKDWASSTTFTLSESTNLYSNYYYYHVFINNYPRRIMFGYTMLSRTGGRLVTKVQMELTLRKMLQPFKNYTWSVPCSSSHLVVPVTYTIGESTLNNFVPPSMHFATATGFLQIRAQSYDGTYYAMCPAVKLNNCDGQYVCIGGVKNGYSRTNDCNDLTDWNGLVTSPDYHTSNNLAHSTKDIESTIMIFYR
uniref:intelectin-1-like n=1 Tax=Ciona intestinalis TaxID=7719 RepID=UPI00089DD3BE|nr:intelectin-1-like [Ciona intestinalis]|eukprot:XP_018669230.1 intelectin-1-like [Ciona intestinalis]